MSINIVINGRFFGRRVTGVDRFGMEVVAAINQMLKNSDPIVSGLDFRILAPSYLKNSSFDFESEHIGVEYVGGLNGHFWEQFELPLATKGRFLANLCNTGPMFYKNQLVVVHDVATFRVPESYSFPFRAWYSMLIPGLYRRSNSICTVSEFSRRELAACFGLRHDLCVLPEGVDHIKRQSSDSKILDRYSLKHRPFVLAVSSLSPHKNFGAVLKAVELLGEVNFDVVIAGGQNPKVFSSNSNDLPSFVKYVGYVSDQELKALYENAACFIFPSLYEGYGLPPTEAMAVGCPVLAANSASIPEICGDAALYFDPSDPSSLTKQLKIVMADSALRHTLRVKGLDRTEKMIWQEAAKILINEIRRVN